ncbi:TetR/AcrR family transcriptional regulator [Streptomyces sp. NBRC 110028]|uniref:TetR/AcrR family transcriptional regulator n=1 Tax=Streptomyces sp. NBRC 110028 TaxID=1621260 RepID=UPI0006E1BCDB|nr:TetR/AcrR family transcriptional regulator [Streptomyces sp. NBRC 110028]
MTDDPSRKRTDARRNRQRIIEVAGDTFAAHGLDVPMREIARRAGVGPATLYRHFPAKEALVAEAFADQMARCVETLDTVLADPDPWHGFSTFIEKVCAMQAEDRGFTAAFLAALPDSLTTDFERVRDHHVRRFAELTLRAQRSGQLRPDFVPGDIKLLIMANGGVGSAAASRRLVALLLQSLRAHPTVPPAPLPPPP